MTVESDLHTALMAQAEVMATALSYEVLWPQAGGDMPAGEHLRVYYLPNDNEAADLNSDTMERKGFLIITLVSPLGGYEAVTKEKAGLIAGYFKRGTRLTKNATPVTIMGHTIKAGRQEADRWETPIWVEYWSMT